MALTVGADYQALVALAPNGNRYRARNSRTDNSLQPETWITLQLLRMVALPNSLACFISSYPGRATSGRKMLSIQVA
jgi:hypothetical protein